MTVRVGVIGVGMMGEDHVRRLTTELAGAAVTALTDVDAGRAAQVSRRFGVEAVYATGQDVIADDNVDGIVVTSWGPTHQEYVLAAIAAGKPVFCEKPLATTAEAGQRILDAEMKAGRRLVQVGFMRRYDPAYRQLKEAVRAGSIGPPLLAHLAHRNPAVPPTFTNEMVINDAAIHEIDLTRWLLAEEISASMILKPKRTSRAAAELQDPMVVLFRTESGVLVDVELNINVGYGYDIRGEVVGETGTARLADGADILVTQGAGRISRITADSRERFIRAFDIEFQEWVDGIAQRREARGPSSWDGYAAIVVADACIAALDSDGWTTISLPDRPDFYQK